MQPAIILTMDQFDDSRPNEREKRYVESQNDVSAMRRQMDKMIAAFGEMKTAIQGNDMGTEGFINRLERVEDTVNDMSKRLGDMEITAKKREFYLLTIFTLIGGAVATIVMKIFELFTKK